MKYLFIIVTLLTACRIAMAQDTVAGKKVSWAPPDYNELYKGTDFVPFNLTAVDGRIVSNETSRGKVTLIVYWFESCRGCREEFTELNELYDSLKNDGNFQFLAVTFDELASLPAYIKEHGLRYPIATTGNRESFSRMAYNMGCPSLALLDKEGKIRLIGINAVSKSKGSSNYEILLNDMIAMIRRLE